MNEKLLNALEYLPSIISEAAKSPLGLAALIVSAVSALALALFSGSGDEIKLFVFVSILASFFVIIMVVFRQNRAKEEREAQLFRGEFPEPNLGKPTQASSKVDSDIKYAQLFEKMSAYISFCSILERLGAITSLLLSVVAGIIASDFTASVITFVFLIIVYQLIILLPLKAVRSRSFIKSAKKCSDIDEMKQVLLENINNKQWRKHHMKESALKVLARI